MTQIESYNLMPVSVVIPTWNAANFVERVLNALVKQRDVTMEIIVLDNGVTNCDTENIVKKISQKYSYIKLFSHEKQLGYAGAVNAGVQHATYPLIAVLNNDNLPEENWLFELLKTYEKKTWQGKPIGVVTSFIPRNEEYNKWRSEYNLWGRVIRSENKQVPSEDFAVFHPDGSALLFNKDIIGLPYENEYFIYHEDSALGWRTRLMGYEVIVSRKSLAQTFDGGSTRRIPYKTAFYSERNRWLNALSFPESKTIIKLTPLWIIDLLISFLFGRRKLARLHAWFWLFSHHTFLFQYRKKMQSFRRIGDEEVLKKATTQYFEVSGRGLVPSLKRSINTSFSFYLRIMGFSN